MNKVEEGIVDTIAAHDIRWLVMGGAAEKHYSEYEPRSIINYCLLNHDLQIIFSEIRGFLFFVIVDPYKICMYG